MLIAATMTSSKSFNLILNKSLLVNKIIMAIITNAIVYLTNNIAVESSPQSVNVRMNTPAPPNKIPARIGKIK